MSSQRLRHTLYHSVPKPDARPVPLWRAAASLDPHARRQEEPLPAAFPRVSSDTRQPLTSAVLAGWVCIGFGLLTAWIFPPAYFFFSIGMVLSIVAMATHQVRAGLLLLAGSAVGIGVSALLFFVGLSALLFHAAKKLPDIKPSSTPNLAAPRFSASPPVALAESISPIATSPVATPRPVPLTLGEVSAMLSAGRNDEDIIAAASNRPLLGRIGTAETTTLHAYGASSRVIEFLQAHFAPDNPPTAYQARPAATTFQAVQTATPNQTAHVTTSASAQPTPMDYAARDRRVADLKNQMDDLDERVRRVRADPHWWGIVKGSTYTTRQQASDAYLKELDRQRDDLRRQKWALEGR